MGAVKTNHLMVGRALQNLEPQVAQGEEAQIDTPLVKAWGKVDTQYIVYTSTPDNLDAPDTTHPYNVLHLNGLGSTASSSIITQIAGVSTGRLYYRNGNQVGWYGTTQSSDNSWRELIDNNGGQSIEGSLEVDTLKFDQIQSDNSLSSIQLDGFALCDFILSGCGGSGLLSGANENGSKDKNINTYTKPGTYLMNVARGTISKGYPLEGACGLLMVIAPLSSTPSYSNYVRQYFMTPFSYKTFVRYTQSGQSGWSTWQLIQDSKPTRHVVDQHISADAFLKMDTMAIGEDIEVDLIYAGDDGTDTVSLYWGTNKSAVGGKWSGWYANTYDSSTTVRTYINNAALPTTGFTWSKGATQCVKAHLWRTA